MLTIQGKFHYQGDLKKTPVDEINLLFDFPVYEYQEVDEGSAVVRRIVSARETLSLRKELKSTGYNLKFPASSITGEKNQDIRMFTSFLMQPDITLEHLTTAFDVRYLTQTNDTPLGQESFEALYFLKLDHTETPSISKILKQKMKHPDVYQEQLARMMFLINKKAYLELFRQISLPGMVEVKKRSSEFEELYLLQIIALLADVQEKQPLLAKESEELNEMALSMLSSVRKPVEALKTIKKQFSSLFEFPVAVPEMKTVEIAGSFTVTTSDGSAIAAKDLSLYDLSVEYLQKSQEGEGHTRTLHFDWDKSNAITGNTVPFSFSELRPVIRNTLAGLISVDVKAYDGSLLYTKDFHPEDPALRALKIEVPLLRPVTLNPADRIPAVGKHKKLRGQVIRLSKKTPLKNLTVVVQAKKEGDDIWRIVGSASTDGSGNFTMPYPYGDYRQAQAIVCLTPDNPADIPIVSGKENETISDDFLYLLVKESDCVPVAGDEECDGKESGKASRLPDQADLIGSPDYSQDLGGSCVNLSTPNRTLNEYSYKAVVRTSDPDVANYTLAKTDKLQGGVYQGSSYTLTGGTGKRKRAPVDLTNPIQWQDAPDDKKNLSFYQTVSVATGHVLHYKALFKADGYSMGDLLYSLALAPGQKKEIVVFDSSHSLRGAESQTISQGERLAAGIVDDREITDQLSGNISESLTGSSSANTSGVSAGLGIGAIIGPVGAVLGVSGGVANSNSSASQDSSRTVSQFFGEKLRQSIMQNAESYRQLNASVVTTVQEGQRYTATTEVVANHNHCHALTMMYFEVLRHYAIFQELSSVEECVFVPLLMTNFTTQNIYKWRDVLARHLLPLPSNTYLQPFSFIGFGRQHPLLRAFDANERITTNYANIDFPAGSYDDERISFVKGDIYLRTNLPRPKTRYDRILSLPVVTRTTTTSSMAGAAAGSAAGGLAGSIIGSVIGSVVPGIGTIIGALVGGAMGTSVGAEIGADTQTTVTLVKKQIFDAFMQLDANYETVPPAQCIRVTNFQPSSMTIMGITIQISGMDFFDNDIVDKELWTTYASILGYDDVLKMLDHYFKNRLISEWDQIFHNDMAPVIFAKIVDSINMEFIATDLTSTVRYRGGERVMRIALNGTTNLKRNEFPLHLKIFSGSELIKKLNGSVTLTVENVRIYYSTPHYNGTLYSGFVNDDLLDGTSLFIPENSDEKRNPRKEDAYLVDKLLEHLNSNLEHYNKVLWYNLDPDRRYMLLDGFNIQIFNDFNLPAGYRSLASVVKNELITITGNALVFPVAAGYRVSQSYIIARSEEGNETVTLFDHYQPLTPVEPYRISVPTRGVFAEAVLGVCNSCEEIESDRLQDWNRFPNTDEPTQILPLTPPSPTITDWKAAFKDLVSPLISIQNAPAAPAPGAGLTGLSELLGKSGVFKDITGLDANQQNVIKTYLSNQENAKAFAEMAKGMAMQSHNTENSDKIMSSLNDAKKSGAISQEDYGTLVKEHLQQQIDGGESKKAEDEKAKTAKPTLTDAAVKAADQGKGVKAQKTDPEGNTETVEISGNNTSSVLAQVSGIVPTLLQKNKLACWATAATMMMCWKKGKSLSVPEVLSQAGDQYLVKFNSGEGLQASEKDEFIAALGMTGEATAANFSLQQYINWLNTYGPLWITTDAAGSAEVFSPHARILTKIVGTGTPDGKGTDFIFNDPATGTEKQEHFADFIRGFEQMILENPDAAFIQVVHFRDKVMTATEGGAPTLSDEEKIAQLKTDNKLTFAAKKEYLDLLAGKSFLDALKSVYTLSRITTTAKDAKGVETTTATGFKTIEDLLDRSTTVADEKAAYKAVDDKGVLKRLKVIHDENIPSDLTDTEKVEAAAFFTDQMEANRAEIQTTFAKTGAEDHLILKSFPTSAEVKENTKSIIHTCIKFSVGNKKHIAYCLATANGESHFQPIMEGNDYCSTYKYRETWAQYYYSAAGKQSYNSGKVANGQTQLSDYLIAQMTAIDYLKVTDSAKRTFTKGKNIDDANFDKLKTLLTTSMSAKDSADKWTDIAKDKAQTAALFAEMTSIVNTEKPAKRIITDEMLMNADFHRYAGKGFIQATGKASYQNVMAKIKLDVPAFAVDLVNEPEKILIPENGIYSLVLGLKRGAYGSGKEIGFYLKDGSATADGDWDEARDCVNPGEKERRKMFGQCAKIYADVVFRLKA
ncbi:MAG: papain-like cysteine protease family protein [Desulfurivibrionaceae bacterium]